MKQDTINHFRNYLKEHGYTNITIHGYSRTICDLEEPPNTIDPVILLTFIEKSLKLKKQSLSYSNFASAQAALSSFFLMRTGIKLKDFRKQCPVEDQYEFLMVQYADYCRDFLHLTEPVTMASVRDVRSFLKNTVPNIHSVEWGDITANDIISYLSNERSNLSAASVGVTATAIRRFFRFLQHNDIEINTSVLNLPLSTPAWSKGGNLPVILTKDEQARLADYSFPETPTGIRDRVILLCFTELGLRCREVASLQIADIQWTRGTIIIRKTKTHSERELPLSEKIGKALEEYVMYARPSSLGSYLFFKSERWISEPASTDNVRSVIRRLYQRLGISGWHVGTHALRRTVGTNLYNAGNDLKTVADVLGHTSVSATKAYVRIDIESLRTVASPWPGR
jgi:site-specific recombinase XerD